MTPILAEQLSGPEPWSAVGVLAAVVLAAALAWTGERIERAARRRGRR